MTQLATVSEKQIAVEKGQATKALKAAQDVVIKDDKTMEEAAELRKKIKQVGKLIKDKKESITKPLMLALANVRDMFRPIEDSHKQATDLIESKITKYIQLKEAVRKIEEEKLQARVEKGTMRPDTALNKMTEMGEVKKSGDTFTTYKHQYFEIIDINKIPREYMLPDETKIRKAMLSGISIEGIQFHVEEKIKSK